MTRAPWNCAVVGVTGAVGRTMVRCLAQSGIPVGSLRGFATHRSAGDTLSIPGPWGETVRVEELAAARLDGLDMVLLSAGGETAREWVPRIVSKGAWAIDNSSAFRMDPKAALIVPEVNPDSLPRERGIVANPNCSTIQMVVVLAPLDQRFRLRRVHVATYQSVSGTGQKGVDAMEAERRGTTAGRAAFPRTIDRNVIPQCDAFDADGFTREELKMIRETQRILDRPDLAIHPTCVRVPVEVGHAEAVHLEFDQPVKSEEIRAVLEESPGIRVQDDPEKGVYPTPIDVAGSNVVWVGRIRLDRCDPRVVELWVVADNLTKGAAYNAVQIASLLHARERGDANVPTPRRV